MGSNRLGPFLLAALCGLPSAEASNCEGLFSRIRRSPDADGSGALQTSPTQPSNAQFLTQLSQNLEGARLLLGRNPNLHMRADIASMDAKLSAAGVQEAQEPINKVAAWLATLEHTLRPGQSADAITALKNQFHNRYVIKQEQIPDSYFQNQRRLARERGHGDVMITDQMKSQLGKVLIDDQKQSLDAWIEYLTSPDAASYPIWAKAWALDEITTLRAMETGAEHFVRRIDSTTGKFPELNREALSMVIDAVTKHAQKQSLNTIHADLKPLVAEARFSKLYAKAIVLTSKGVSGLEETKGTWVKFAKGSKPDPLVQSLACKNTGWCTAGESTASTQLSQGDFYVYYSNDKLGKPTQPRIAIRMEGDAIAEVRGIGKDQHLDSFIAEKDILKEKLKEFGDEGAKYHKKDADMKRLTQIEAQLAGKNPTPLTKEQLRFLYEIDARIEGFGYNRDPRIDKILKTRDIKQDLAFVFDTTPDRISSTREQALKGNIVYHTSSLSWYNPSAEDLTLPHFVRGDLNLSSLTSAKGLTLPQSVGGSLNLSSLTSAKGLTLPRFVGRNLLLQSLTSAKGLTLPQSVGGLFLNLTSAEGLNLPQSVGDLFLNRLTSVKGLTLPRTVGGSLDLSGLTSAEGLKLPQSVRRDLVLNGLTSAKGLTLPQSVGQDLYLSNLESIEGLEFRGPVGGMVYLESISAAEARKIKTNSHRIRIIIRDGEIEVQN